MKVVLVQQVDPSAGGTSFQIPSRAASLDGALGDAQAIKSLGIGFGINSGVGTTNNPSFADVTSHFRGAMTGSQDANWQGILDPNHQAGWDAPSTSDVKWLSMNIEPTEIVAAVNGVDPDASLEVPVPTNAGGNVDLPWLKTADPSVGMVRQFMGEVARQRDLTYDATSPTLLKKKDGSVHVPTYADLHESAVACMNGASEWLRGTSDAGPGWQHEIINDWRQGINPIPFSGSGWWTMPASSSTAYLVPNRGASDKVVKYVRNGSPQQFLDWTPGNNYGNASLFQSRIIDKAFVTSVNARRILPRVASVTSSFYFEPSTLGISDLDASLLSIVSGKWLEVNIQGGESTFKYDSLLLSEVDAKESIKKAARASWLGTWSALGPQSGFWVNGTFGFNYGNTPFWGLTSTPADFKACVLDALTDPVTSSEVSGYNLSPWGVQAGDVLIPGTFVIWNATQYYLQSLFSSSANALPGGIYPSILHDGVQVGPLMARNNLEHRALLAGWSSSTVPTAWENRSFSTNQWYKALARILTDDLIERCEAVQSAFNAARLKGAARSSRVSVS